MTPRAMVLAAGRGERMQGLTKDRPKPLLEVGGRSLIAHTLHSLADAGVRDVVVNLGYRGAQLREAIGDGREFGLDIAWSDEGDPPLETGGGVFRALPMLGPSPFLLVNGDVWIDGSLRDLAARAGTLAENVLSHLVLVDNPPHHPQGDFALDGTRVHNGLDSRLTFSGLSVIRPALFQGCRDGRFPLAPLWRRAADAGAVTGERFRGVWSDVGTPARLAELDERLGNDA